MRCRRGRREETRSSGVKGRRVRVGRQRERRVMKEYGVKGRAEKESSRGLEGRA